jgi:hypothetical protein
MKKIKLIIMSVAVITSIGGAFATKLHQTCTGSTQYYASGGGYTQVPGAEGTAYICMSGGTTCTYYLNNGVYQSCQSGSYTLIGLKDSKPKSGK